DGPCPPWNDEIIHHYVFTVYALNIDQLPVSGRFGGPEVRAAIFGHVLAEASLTGTYTLNAKLGA
ncbi:MAG: YbhB/YbcL family Raf kinase inhibitor-like protein, partial [Azonexus sp.]